MQNLVFVNSFAQYNIYHPKTLMPLQIKPQESEKVLFHPVTSEGVYIAFNKSKADAIVASGFELAHYILRLENDVFFLTPFLSRFQRKQYIKLSPILNPRKCFAVKGGPEKFYYLRSPIFNKEEIVEKSSEEIARIIIQQGQVQQENCFLLSLEMEKELDAKIIQRYRKINFEGDRYFLIGKNENLRDSKGMFIKSILFGSYKNNNINLADKKEFEEILLYMKNQKNISHHLLLSYLFMGI